MAHGAVVTIAIGNKRIAARLGHQHVRKIFSAHGGLLGSHICFAHDAGHHPAGKLGFLGRVDGRRVIAHKFKAAVHTKRLRCVHGHLAHAQLNHVQHFNRERAHCTLQLHAIRDHISGLSGVNHRDRDHARINRLFVTANDGLKGLHHLASHRHRVQPVVWHGGVAPFAANHNFEFIAGRHYRPGTGGKLANLRARPVVHAKHRIHREFFK